MNSTRRRIILSRIIFITVGAAMCFIFLAFPRCQDDFWFIADITRLGADADGSFSLARGIGACISEHFLTDNGRLGNTLAITLIYFPHWIAALLNGAAFIVMYLLMTRLGGVGRSHPSRLIVLTALMLLWHPWSRYIFSVMFSFNYVWSSMLVLVCVLLALRDTTCRPFIAIAAGLIGGAWHEAGAVAILAGAAAVYIMCPAMRRKVIVYIGIGAFIGLCINLAAPGPWYRASQEPDRHEFAVFQLRYLTGCIVYILLWLTLLCRRSWRTAAMSPIAVWAFAATVSLTVVAYITVHANAAWTACTLAVCATCSISWQLWPHFGSTRTSVAITCLLALFTVGNLAATTSLTVSLGTRMNRLTQLADSLAPAVTDGDTLIIYTPVIHTAQYPAITLQRPMPDMFANEHDNMYNLNNRYNRRIHIIALPEQLRDYRNGMGSLIEGPDGFRWYEDCIVGPPAFAPGWTAVICGYCGSERREWRPGNLINFTGADGLKHSYLEVDRSILSLYLGVPTYIAIPPAE